MWRSIGALLALNSATDDRDNLRQRIELLEIRERKRTERGQ